MAHQWRGLIAEYGERLPVTAATPNITLLEGGTPLIASRVLSGMLDAEVWLKVDGANPTGSFKDRGMTVAISKAAERGAKAVICASTGNTSASAAAYAVKAGMVAAVLVPDGKIAMGKMAQAVVHGAKILQVEGNFDDCLMLARKLAEGYPIELVNSVNPDRIEGQKTAAFEIVDAPGHPLPSGRQRRQHHGLLEGLQRVRGRWHLVATPAHVGIPGRGRRAHRARPHRRAPRDHRHGDPHREPGLLAAGGRCP
jgi:threonine synthase